MDIQRLFAYRKVANSFMVSRKIIKDNSIGSTIVYTDGAGLCHRTNGHDAVWCDGTMEYWENWKRIWK